ncbi:Serine carboxypeptidase-like 7 [Acorus calamus]|uniref:Serine carboxypeptidase-like 7 n=1 Tax=Acorus calamus TaxID=4465 RepID=A0AAV9FBQ7_ACOCL|nr:Serine carboxypeptidase-like 7 [Acorus calamus]
MKQWLGRLLITVLVFITSTAISTSSSWTVKTLPGFDGPLPFDLETGYTRVDEERDAQIFYYFIKSERSPYEDPLMVWIAGGPGCSALTSLAFEIGPLHFEIKEYKGELPTLILHPHSWTKVSNILFIDSPIGTGFSFARGSDVYIGGDVKSSKQVHKFIRKWLHDHPQFSSNPLYIGGDSYSGKVVPIITHVIAEDVEAGKQPLINLKGYVIGNPGADVAFDDNAFVSYSYGMGFISEELYESAKKSCNGNYARPQNTLCASYVEAINKCTSGLNEAHILAPKCVRASPHLSLRRSLADNSSELLSPPPTLGLECHEYGFMLSYYWANNDAVREALHVQKGTVDEWIRCPNGLSYVKDVPSSLPYQVGLTNRGYRALVYSGDHDLLSHMWARKNG